MCAYCLDEATETVAIHVKHPPAMNLRLCEHCAAHEISSCDGCWCLVPSQELRIWSSFAGDPRLCAWCDRDSGLLTDSEARERADAAMGGQRPTRTAEAEAEERASLCGRAGALVVEGLILWAMVLLVVMVGYAILHPLIS